MQGRELMINPTLITVLRHGEVEGAPHVFRGKGNPALSPRGLQQMRQATLAAPRLDSIATSPLARCRAFADSLAAEMGMVPVVLDDFREMDFGDWEGKTPQAAQALTPELFESFRNNPEGLSPPNGEPFDVFRERVTAAFRQWLGNADGGHRLLITHAGVMRILLIEHLGLPVCNLYRIALPNAASFQLSILPGHPPCLLNLNNGLSCAA